MNNLIRSTARCLRSGAAVYLPRPADGRVWSAPARFLCSAADLQKDLGEMVKKDKVVVFMKGTPAQPLCGFSNAVVQILRMHGVDEYAAYNVLEDQELREGQFTEIRADEAAATSVRLSDEPYLTGLLKFGESFEVLRSVMFEFVLHGV